MNNFNLPTFWQELVKQYIIPVVIETISVRDGSVFTQPALIADVVLAPTF